MLKRTETCWNALLVLELIDFVPFNTLQTLTVTLEFSILICPFTNFPICKTNVFIALLPKVSTTTKITDSNLAMCCTAWSTLQLYVSPIDVLLVDLENLALKFIKSNSFSLFSNGITYSCHLIWSKERNANSRFKTLIKYRQHH